MFGCDYCKLSFGVRKDYIKHLKNHLFIGVKIFPIYCRYKECNISFYDLKKFNRHLRDIHNSSNNLKNGLNKTSYEFDNTNLSNIFEIEDNNTSLNMPNEEIPNNEHGVIQKLTFNSDEFFSELKADIFTNILKLKAKAQLSETSLNEVINTVSSVYEKINQGYFNFLWDLSINLNLDQDQTIKLQNQIFFQIIFKLFFFKKDSVLFPVDDSKGSFSRTEQSKDCTMLYCCILL